MAKKAASPAVDNRGKEIIKALQSFEEARGLSVETVVEALKESLVSAYQKETDKDAMARAEVDINTGEIKLFNLKTIVEEVEDDLLEISLEEVKQEKPDVAIGDTYEIPVKVEDFMRATAMQVKTVLKQKIREAEKESIYNEFITKKDEIITGIVEKISDKFILINLGRVFSIMPVANMIPGERYHVGDLINVYVVNVVKDTKGSPVIVSRNDPNFLRRLFEKEITEIYEGIVEIRAIAREAGDRSKIAVSSNKTNVDPTGACIGPKGTRIQSISQQLLGEKIDVIQYSEVPELYVAEALKPAVVYGLAVNEEDHAMIAIVANEDFSHAIGKRGQNARLAVKLTGWKIDIKTVDEALSQNIFFRTMNEIQRNVEREAEAAKYAPAEEIMPIVNEEVNPVVETAPIELVVEKIADVKVEPQVKITSSIYEATIPYNATSSLEERKTLEEVAATIKEQTKSAKKVKEEKVEKVKEEKTEKEDTSKNYMPVYSKEELQDLENEENDTDTYEDDVDYDDYDEYYDE